MKLLPSLEQKLGKWSDDRFYLVLLSIMAALVAFAMTKFGLDLHRNFLTIACDTAEFQNAIVNTLHGRWFRDTAYDGPSILGLHSLFILLPLAIVYAFVPSPDTLFVIQIWSVYGTVIPLYLVAREILTRPLAAFLVASSALISPMLLHLALSPFHPETWIGAAVLWAYYFYRRDRWRAFGVAVAIALTSGEEATFICLALGLLLFFVEDGIPWRRKYAVGITAVSFGWLALTLGFIAPMMHAPGQQNLLAHHYEQWNITSAGGLVVTLISHPFAALGTLLSPVRWIHTAILIGPPLFLMFLSRQSLILAAPLPISFLMCDREFFLYFHAYYFQFAFLAGYVGLIFFLLRRDFTTRVGQIILASTYLLTLLALCAAFALYVTLLIGRDEALSQSLHDAFDQIPAEAAVYSPHRYSAYLSGRENMVMGDLRDDNLDFNAMIDRQFGTTNVHASEIDYIVCDLLNDQCGWRQTGFDPDAAKRRAANINRLIQTGAWQVSWNQDNVVILRRVPK